ncbi:hypothetical protein Hypma_001013 [Hypsizygus marmoreus]|uniref:Protein kinase domain-containing protein n=1 Tax=Hypsizygus marmoreus TaxID=39966 RepID=A0A369JAQ1_HYPMA|nr:hypothetical protein Hypma_001013 [Hypsizygus marmoreus]
MATLASQPMICRQISIAGVKLQSSFYRLDIEGCEYPDMPDDKLITRSPSLQRSDKISPSEWTQWGMNGCLYDSALCFDCCTKNPDPSSGLHTWFKLKMILHLEQGTGSAPEDMAKELMYEAKFYATHLRNLQGSHVPTHYGVWTAQTSWGGSVMCEIMEHAGNPFQLLGKHDTPKNRDACAAAVLDLHRNGIVHKQLSHPQVTWHILWDKRKSIPRIVDFACAFAGHDCPRSLPLCRYKSAPMEKISCHELIWAGEYLELYGKKAVADDDEVQKALEILDKYEETHWGEGYNIEDGLAVQESWIKQHRAKVAAAEAAMR